MSAIIANSHLLIADRSLACTLRLALAARRRPEGEAPDEQINRPQTAEPVQASALLVTGCRLALGLGSGLHILYGDMFTSATLASHVYSS